MENNFKIICPIDFSECSLNAIEFASRLGEQYKADLILFHVLDLDDYRMMFPNDRKFNDQNDFVTLKMEELQKTIQAESIPKGLKSCKTVIQEGSIVSSILDFVELIKSDLLVIGTEGMNSLRHNIVGSKASQIVEKSNIDVLVVPRRVFFKAPKKLIYASDYQEEDKLAIQKVVEMARFYDAEIDFVHMSSHQKSIDKALHFTMVDEIIPFVNYDKINFYLKSVRVDLASGLENYLQKSKGDMLITLSKKKSFFDLIFSTKLSKKMAYFINRPLWVIKSF
jgi:nucleotide-binding universal stress UspA family protein